MTPMAPAHPITIAEAAGLLRQGGLVGFPTETVYGLGADATDERAVARLYAAKGRPNFNPLITHVNSADEAQEHGVFSAMALRLADAFWPGPLTLVVPAAPTCRVSLLARAGLDSVALRLPAHPVARSLIAAVGRPVVAPSANRSGRISPTDAAHVLAELDGRIDMILDGGRCAVGLESTILSCLGRIELLRPGGISREAIETVLGREVRTAVADAGRPVAPGLLSSHYAPSAAVRLAATGVTDEEAVLDFGARLAGRCDGPFYLDLSPTADLNEAAANLFAFLRALDRSEAAGIAVAPIPLDGLGAAINDRLRRAAAPREAQGQVSRDQPMR